MKHVVLMCLLIYTSMSEIFNRSVTVGKDVYLVCKHEGRVIWSKDRDGTRVDILTAETDGETIKLTSVPHNRYSLLDDLSLEIKSVSLSDSGIYYCNETPTVNLTVTEADSTTSNDRHAGATTPKPETTTSSYSQPGATTSTPETTTSNYSQPGATNPTPVISTKTTQPTQSNSSHSKFNSTKETTTSSQPGATTPTTETITSNNSQPGATTSTPAKPKPTLDSSATTTCCTTNTTKTNTTTTIRKTTTENNKGNNKQNNEENKPTYITAAVLGGVLVLILLLWACIKRKSLSSALSNKKENIYETVDDSCSTVHPAPPQKTNDAIYYLAGDPDVVKIGQRQEFDDPTYTLIGLSESKSKENLNEQEPDVPLYSTIKEFSE